MKASACIGRVGGLAVALGVGTAAAVISTGMAWATPTEGSSSSAGRGASASDETSSRGQTSRRAARSSEPVRFAATSVDAGAAVGGATTSPREVRARSRGDRAGLPGPASAQSTSVSGTESRAAVDVQSPSLSVEVGAVASAAPRLAVVEPLSVEEPPMAQPGVSLGPVGELAFAGAAVLVTATAEAAQPAAQDAVVESVGGPESGPGPLAPLGTAVSWVMLAAARREIGSSAAAQDVLPVSATGPVVDPGEGGVDTVAESVLPAPAAAGDAAQVLVPVAVATADNPIAAFFEQIGAFVSQIVTAITQVITGVLSAITNIFPPFLPNNGPTLSTPTVGTPDAASGVVTGVLGATDADGDTLTFSVPTHPSKGSVSINATTGAFTYTPTALARFNAASQNAPAADKTDSFAVTVSDGRGGVVEGTVAVPVSPASPSLIALPGRTYAAPVVGASGVVFQTSWNGNETFVTRIQADGETATFTQNGQNYSGGIVGLDGTVYQVSSTETATTIRAFRPDGSIEDYIQAGTSNGNRNTVLASNGNLYQSIATGNAESGYSTTVLAVRPDGSSATRSQPGSDIVGLLTLNDGSVYQLSKDETKTHISAFRPDGQVSSYTLTQAVFGGNWTDVEFYPIVAASDGTYLRAGALKQLEPGVYESYEGLVRLSADGTVTVVFAPQRGDSIGAIAVADDGTVYRTLGYYDTSASDWPSLTYAIITRPDGVTVRTADWDGLPAGPAVVAPNGLAYQVSNTDSTTTVTALGADGGTTAYTSPGISWNYPFINSDGSVGQFSYQSGRGSDSTSVLIIQPDGSSATFTQPGQPGGFRPLISDQAMYVWTIDQDAATTLLRRYAADGSTSDITLPGWPWGEPTIGADGSVYATSYRSTGGAFDKEYLNIARPDGTIDSYQWDGLAGGGAVIGAGGIVYKLSSLGLWIVDKVPDSN